VRAEPRTIGATRLHQCIVLRWLIAHSTLTAPAGSTRKGRHHLDLTKPLAGAPIAQRQQEDGMLHDSMLLVSLLVSSILERVTTDGPSGTAQRTCGTTSASRTLATTTAMANRTSRPTLCRTATCSISSLRVRSCRSTGRRKVRRAVETFAVGRRGLYCTW
jgi:hypothetical protein